MPPRHCIWSLSRFFFFSSTTTTLCPLCFNVRQRFRNRVAPHFFQFRFPGVLDTHPGIHFHDRRIRRALCRYKPRQVHFRLLQIARFFLDFALEFPEFSGLCRDFPVDLILARFELIRNFCQCHAVVTKTIARSGRYMLAIFFSPRRTVIQNFLTDGNATSEIGRNSEIPATRKKIDGVLRRRKSGTFRCSWIWRFYRVQRDESSPGRCEKSGVHRAARRD